MSEKKVTTLKKIAKKKVANRNKIPTTDVSFYQSIDVGEKQTISIHAAETVSNKKDGTYIRFTISDSEESLGTDTLYLSVNEARMVLLAFERAIRLVSIPKYLFSDKFADLT